MIEVANASNISKYYLMVVIYSSLCALCMYKMLILLNSFSETAGSIFTKFRVQASKFVQMVTLCRPIGSQCPYMLNCIKMPLL